jgi:dihydrofolate synthase/folylpolyglutamate synthase
MRVVERAAAEADAPLVRADDPPLAEMIAALPLSLPGAHQRANAAVALRLLETLDAGGVIRVPEDARLAGLTTAAWPGRLETIVSGGRPILLDAAHNPAGARALASYLRSAAPGGVTLIFAAMRDKAVAEMLGELAPVVRTLICTTAPTPRALPADELAALAAARGLAARAVADPMAAIALARTLSDPIVVAGSIFLIGAVRGPLYRDILR